MLKLSDKHRRRLREFFQQYEQNINAFARIRAAAAKVLTQRRDYDSTNDRPARKVLGATKSSRHPGG